MTLTGSPLKFMPPGHFCPDVCGIEDFGVADYWRGRVVRAFFKLMRFWPKPTARCRSRVYRQAAAFVEGHEEPAR